MKLTLVLFGLLLSPCLFAQNNRASDSEGRAYRVEIMWKSGTIDARFRRMQSLIGERFLSTEWDGQLSSHRDQFLADIRDPKFKPSVMSVQDLKVEFLRRHGYRCSVSITPRASTTELDHTGRFTDTWIHQNSAWKCVASHTSLMQK